MERAILGILVNHAVQAAHTAPAANQVRHKSYFGAKQLEICILTLVQVTHILCWWDAPVTWPEALPLALMVFGLTLRFRAYVEMGPLFTFIPEIQANHRIVSSGPYAYVAHPGYLGQFAMLMGAFGYYYPPFWISVPVLGYVGYRFYTRIKEEEGMLTQHFGEAYRAYKGSVWF